MKKFSVIIPVYNNPEELVMTLQALMNQSIPMNDLEVLVVDDGSTIDMRAVIEQFADEICIRYFFQEDAGFRPGTARNVGIRAAEGELCVFMDCGVIPVSNCLEEHYYLYQQHGEKTVILGYIYGCDKTSDLEEMRRIIDSNTPDNAARRMDEAHMLDGREEYWGKLGDDMSRWTAPWIALWGGHFSVPTKFLRDNGILFDEHFTTWGGEDNEFGIQMELAGANFIVGRSAKAIHYPAKERSYDKLQKNKDFRENQMKNKAYIGKKYPDNKIVQCWVEKGIHVVNQVPWEKIGKF